METKANNAEFSAAQPEVLYLNWLRRTRTVITSIGTDRLFLLYSRPPDEDRIRSSNFFAPSQWLLKEFFISFLLLYWTPGPLGVAWMFATPVLAK